MKTNTIKPAARGKVNLRMHVSRTGTKKPPKNAISVDSDSDDSWNVGDGFGPSSARRSKTVKVLPRKTETVKEDADNDGQLWVDKYAPTMVEDLAVHKKKIDEVRAWLLDALCKQVGSVLVLTGPTGVGKTTTLRCLALELGFQISEWFAPPQDDWDTYQSQWGIPGGRSTLVYQSVMDNFGDFLKRSGRYKTLFGDEKKKAPAEKKIVLVKELPVNLSAENGRGHSSSKSLDSFHTIMQKYARSKTGFPVVVVLSEHQSGGSSSQHKLFPPDLFPPTVCSEIQFNAVNMTLLKKTLALICRHENLSLDMKAVEKWAEACEGDIRSAVSMIQFGTVSTKEGIKPATTTTLKRRRQGSIVGADAKKTRGKKIIKGKDVVEGIARSSTDPMHSGVYGKDGTLFLLHAVGKVLHNKRTILEKHTPAFMALDARLPVELRRHDLKYNPEDVVGKIHASGLTFRLLLHENYVAFFSDIESVVTASEYMSESDLVDHWQDKQQQELSTLVGVRGLSFARSGREVQSNRPGWMPLHKTKWYEVTKAEDLNKSAANSLFTSTSSNKCNPVTGMEVRRDDFFVTGLTYLDEISKSLLHQSKFTSAQVSYMDRMCTWNKHCYRPRQLMSLCATPSTNIDEDLATRDLVVNRAFEDGIDQFD
eukprot:CFRG2981T1